MIYRAHWYTVGIIKPTNETNEAIQMRLKIANKMPCKSAYELKIEKVLNVYSDLDILWREGKLSFNKLNDLCEILDEYTDLIEEATP